MKNIRFFYLKNFVFLEVKFSIYLNRRVFIMTKGSGELSLELLVLPHISSKPRGNLSHRT